MDRFKQREKMMRITKKKQKKNYYELFAKFCADNSIWFAVCTSGSVDQLTAFFDGVGGSDIFGHETIDFEFGGQFGTKTAYERLVKEYASIVEDNKNDA